MCSAEIVLYAAGLAEARCECEDACLCDLIRLMVEKESRVLPDGHHRMD